MSFETTDVTPTAANADQLQQTTQKVGVIAIVIASIIGSICLILSDILQNKVTSTAIVAKYAQVRLPQFNVAELELYAIILMMLIGLGLCYVFRPQSLPGAFARSSGLHGVLFTINTIGGLAGAAGAQGIWTPSATATQIIYSFETPENYGPLGLGTRITGRSSAKTLMTTASGPVEISSCLETLKVGEGVYCSITQVQAKTLLNVDAPMQNKKVWVQINTPGWN